MKAPQKPITYRMLRAIILTMVAVLIAFVVQRQFETNLGRPDFFSGYVLLAACSGLMLLSMRKRLLVLPLGTVAIWQQMHQYLGLFAVASYLMHTGLIVHGVFETVLAVLFWTISLSGILGWYINYSTPKRMATAGPAVLRDDIAILRRQIAGRAYAIALMAAGKLESATLAEHYTQRLQSFFLRRRSLAYCLVPNGRQRRELLHDLDQMIRYLGPEGRSSQASLCQMVREKDDLDFQWAMQNRLRGWVILHVSLVWSFFILVACHVYMVHRFHGT